MRRGGIEPPTFLLDMFNYVDTTLSLGWDVLSPETPQERNSAPNNSFESVEMHTHFLDMCLRNYTEREHPSKRDLHVNVKLTTDPQGH